MGAPRCTACVSAPTMRCGRCMATFCSAHPLPVGRRCSACEADFADEATTRRAAKVIFAPPIAILSGGLLFLLLLNVSLGGAIGAFIMCAIACGTAVGAGAGACRLVDRSARALFLRERAARLPAARLLTR